MQNIFGWRLGKIKLDLKQDFYKYKLRGLKALELVRHNAVLVGNAAHTVSPIAAQGLNLGFQDAKVLTEIFINDENLKIYQYKRMPSIDKIFDKCHLLSRHGNKLSAWGLWLFGFSPWLQQQTIQMGSGY